MMDEHNLVQLKLEAIAACRAVAAQARTAQYGGRADSVKRLQCTNHTVL
jgi:hypothetical protein